MTSHEILRIRMPKFMRISADADPDAELRNTSNVDIFEIHVDNLEIVARNMSLYFKLVFGANA